MHNRLGYLRSQEAQPEYPCEVGRADASLAAQFPDRLASAGHEHVTKLAGLSDEAEEAAIWLLMFGACGALDQELHFHARAPDRGRDRQDLRRLV